MAGVEGAIFDYHRDVPPEVAAQILGGKVVYSESRKGQWIAVIEMERMWTLRTGFRNVLPSSVLRILR